MKATFNRLISLFVSFAMIYNILSGLSLLDMHASAVEDNATYSINFDPNGGVLKYGTVGNIGACKENDTNNQTYNGSAYRMFPTYYENLTDANGQLLFPGAATIGYDYTEMLTYAINTEANNHAAGRDTYEIRIEEGVYYLGGTLKVWGHFSLNGIYGKTVFVCESNDTALFKAGSNQTYYEGGSISDITFVAKQSHAVFSTGDADAIHAMALSPEIKPVKDYYCFQNVNVSWFKLKNCTISGFASPLSGVKGHMCSHIQDNSFGPCIVAFNGTHFIDCYIHDNYFYGGVIERDGHMDLPLFTTGIGANLTTMNNNHIENFFYGKGESDTYGASYTNNTYNYVYGIQFFSAGDSTNSVSQCLFSNNTYSDIAGMFENLGYVPYSESNKGANSYVIHCNLYTQGEISFNKITADNRSCIIQLDKGMTLTQCKFEEQDMTDTDMYRYLYVSTPFRQRGYCNIQILDNAYKIASFQKNDIFRDNINLKDNGMSKEWADKFFISRQTSAENCIYYDPVSVTKIDLSCFYSPSSNNTLGYESSGSVGADEATLSANLERQYYNDIAAGKNIVYLSDFGAGADDMGSDSVNIQRAFDTISETGDILVIEGTYTITTPVLLRGGRTYRVVSNGGATSQNYKLVGGGFSLDVSNETLAKTGAFVQDASDTGTVGGYFIGVNIYPDNIGSGSYANRKGSAFYQVRFKDMLISGYRYGYMETTFKECHIKNSIIEEGYNQYNSNGIMKRCIFENSLHRNSYATGSHSNYGNGISYAYYLVDTDFVNSTMRGNWIEFMQMTNGFRLAGDGNSLYTGNIWDYVWNFQFGRNDVFAGNSLTHCDTTDITNHLMNVDNIPKSEWTTELAAGNITLMHVSDGVKIVGNVFCNGSTQYTTFFNFDGRTTLYRQEGKIATSISNARIAGNITGNSAGAAVITQVLCSDTLLKENCKGNNIDLTSMAKSQKYIPDTQEYPYNEENYAQYVIPGTLVWLWEKENSSLHYYGEFDAAVPVTKLPDNTLVFDLEYELESTSGDSRDGYTVFDYNFADEYFLLITDEDGNVTDEACGIVSSYLNRTPFISPFNEANTIPEVAITDSALTPDKENAYVLYSQSAYMNSESKSDKTSLSALEPVYLFADTSFKDCIGFYETEMIVPDALNPVGGLPAFIYAEDDTAYYGVIPHLQNKYALRCRTFSILKSNNGIIYGTNQNNGGVLPAERGTSFKVASTDISVDGKNKVGNNLSGNIYFDGTSIEANKDNSTTIIYDETGLNTPVIKMKIEMEYIYQQNIVDIKAIIDFSDNIAGNTPENKVTQRRINLGTFSIEDRSTLAGMMFFNDAWISHITYGGDPDFVREDIPVFNAPDKQEDTCIHAFTEYIRVKPGCTSGGYDSYICSRCKKTLSYTEYGITHNYDETLWAYDTLTHWNTCNLCNTKVNEDIHSFITTDEITSDTTLYICSCGYSYTKENNGDDNNTPDEYKNLIIGISDGDRFIEGQAITFHAIGSGMTGEETNAARFIPENWSVNPSGSWDSAPYTATFVIETSGSYTLTVKYREEVYQDTVWVASGNYVEKSVNFIVVEKPQTNIPPYAPPESDTTTANPSITTSIIYPGYPITTTAPGETTAPDETTVPDKTTVPDETTVPEETTVPDETTGLEETVTEEDTDTTQPAEVEEQEENADIETLEPPSDQNPDTGVTVSVIVFAVACASLITINRTKKHR